jgi:hypothetical protein
LKKDPPCPFALMAYLWDDGARYTFPFIME